MFGFDQLLHHYPDRLTDKVDEIPGAERLSEGTARPTPFVALLQCVTWSFDTEDSADVRLLRADPPDRKAHDSRAPLEDAVECVGDRDRSGTFPLSCVAFESSARTRSSPVIF